MYKKQILSYCCALAIYTASAQQTDSLPGLKIDRTLLLKEVTIQPEKGISQSYQDQQRSNLQVLTDKILESTPGINMIRRGNFAMEPTIRSLNNGQITMTIDGMRIFGACTDRMDPISSYVEPNNLESLSFSVNPGGASYGSSIGGGINFKLKSPSFTSEKKVSGSAGLGFESNGQAYQSLAGIEYSAPNFAIQANGIFRRSGNYTAGNVEEISFSQYRKWNGNVSALFKTSEHTYLKTDYIQDEGFDIGYPALTMDVSFAKAKIGALSYVYFHPEKNIYWETKAYYNYINHAMDDTKRPKETVPMHMDMPGTSRTMGAYSALTYQPTLKHHIKARLDGFNNQLSAEMTMYPDDGAAMFMYTLPDLARTDIGLNLSDDISLNDQFNLQIGGRFDYAHDYIFSEVGKEQLSGMFVGDLSRNRFITNLNLELGYTLSHAWKFSAEVARAARSSTLQEGYSFYIYNRLDGYDYIGNPDLKQETSTNVNLSTRFHSARFVAEVSGFGYFFKNYITGSLLQGYSVMTIGANGVKHYVSLPSAKLVGAELALKWSPLDNLILTSLNTYARGSDNQGNGLPMIAPLKTVNAILYNFKQVSLQAESISYAAQNNVNTAIYGETSTPSSTILNLSVSKEFKFKGSPVLRANAGVDNLLDREYVQHLDIMKIARPGRNFLFRMTALF
ncbi:TonB-dependent receptor [Arcticibacter eurypsychrophilus]|uniref:TonB-dependent receptor n=1 Tax=Arcticibacter eurypsychrophilus TaxID=1434752 RepID=UPI00084D1632|nr:TonB-dependent receptor [Arcticibacter eurypsychrophilus]